MSVRIRSALAAAFLLASAGGAQSQSEEASAQQALITRISERLEPARQAASDACGTPLAIAFDPQSLERETAPLARLSACRAAFSALEGYCAGPERPAAVSESVTALLCVTGSTRLISLSEGILRFEEKPGADDPGEFVSQFLSDAL